jgi:hypothetical protein
MKLNQSLVFILITLSLQSCASTPRMLSVKSDPADAEVCIKGKHGNQYFKQGKSCVGTTPFEADSVTIADEKGRKRVVHFNELDQEKDRFYIVISREGYAPQSMEVPSWEHYVTLRQEQPKQEVVAAPVPVAPATKGAAKITSDPVGALVYVNDFLKGNTPYVLEGENGQTIRLKVEQAGYLPIEQSITMESGKTMEINLSMEKELREPSVSEDELEDEARSIASQLEVQQ